MAGFPRERRVHRASEIRAIVAGGRSVDGANLKVHVNVDPDRAAPPRAAVVVPRYGRTAVERNRLRRRLRELVRLHLLETPELRGGALVVRARAGAYGLGFADLRAELLQLVEHLVRRLGAASS